LGQIPPMRLSRSAAALDDNGGVDAAKKSGDTGFELPAGVTIDSEKSQKPGRLFVVVARSIASSRCSFDLFAGNRGGTHVLET
jgi:hypothetical protein